MFVDPVDVSRYHKNSDFIQRSCTGVFAVVCGAEHLMEASNAFKKGLNPKMVSIETPEKKP